MRRLLPLLALVLLGACTTPQGTASDGPTALERTDAAPPASSEGDQGADAPAEPGTGGVLDPSPPFDLDRIALVGPDGERVELDVYVADDDRERRRGLMHREHLPEGAGMVFRYGEERTTGFWMKNTRIPLSIAYYDADGVIVDIRDMDPCTEDPCPGYPPDHPYRGALEVNQGAFERWGVEPGWRVQPAG